MKGFLPGRAALCLFPIINYIFAFSTDEFMACDRFYETKRRARILEDIPCDMESRLFCDRKGSSYPEAAIWRFKEENRALMKRMYGDLESTSLYREMRASKLGPQGGGRPPPGGAPHDIFSSLQYDIRVGSGFPKESKLMKKVIRKRIRNDSGSYGSSTAPVSLQGTPFTEINTESGLQEAAYAESNRSTSTTGLPERPSSTNSPSSSNTIPAESSTAPFVGTEAVVEEETPLTPPQMHTSEAPFLYTSQTRTNSDEDLDSGFFTVPSTTTHGLRVTTTPEDLLEEVVEEGTRKPVTFSTLKVPVSSSDPESREDLYLDEILPQEDAIFFEPSEEDYDFNGPSENACPVKEEVLAPFWANNTRDQVLALLNLYPFEQYIHMETCELENQRFQCSEGCRCEQQYRLHRLLAFDPSNECRGIFSDWFRFPSYCVCKCYKRKNALSDFSPGDGSRLRRKPRLSGSHGTSEIPRRKKK